LNLLIIERKLAHRHWQERILFGLKCTRDGSEINDQLSSRIRHAQWPASRALLDRDAVAYPGE